MRRDPHGIVVLSKRNLLALLHKVDDKDSAKTICNGDLIVKAEPDADHYKDRLPGEMSPKTEKFIAAGGGCDAG